MGRKRTYTIKEVIKKQSLFSTAVPFDITKHGEVIATVIKPSGLWRSCENCEENTQNIYQFKDENGKWQKLILCDKCQDELLRQS